jgi:hypothetical protein
LNEFEVSLGSTVKAGLKIKLIQSAEGGFPASASAPEAATMFYPRKTRLAFTNSFSRRE